MVFRENYQEINVKIHKYNILYFKKVFHLFLVGGCFCAWRGRGDWDTYDLQIDKYIDAYCPVKGVFCVTFRWNTVICLLGILISFYLFNLLSLPKKKKKFVIAHSEMTGWQSYVLYWAGTCSSSMGHFA